MGDNIGGRGSAGTTRRQLLIRAAGAYAATSTLLSGPLVARAAAAGTSGQATAANVLRAIAAFPANGIANADWNAVAKDRLAKADRFATAAFKNLVARRPELEVTMTASEATAALARIMIPGYGGPRAEDPSEAVSVALAASQSNPTTLDKTVEQTTTFQSPYLGNAPLLKQTLIPHSDAVIADSQAVVLVQCLSFS